LFETEERQINEFQIVIPMSELVFVRYFDRKI